jgi:hypothetical protein
MLKKRSNYGRVTGGLWAAFDEEALVVHAFDAAARAASGFEHRHPCPGLAQRISGRESGNASADYGDRR